MDRKRIMSLDIIKGIAMIMVIVVHYNQSFSSNVPLFRFCQMGCQIFFVASGFGAAMSIAKKSENESYSDTCKKFYLSRISAIAPAWWFMMAAIYLINTITLYFFGRTVGFSTNRSITGIICNLFFLNGLNPLCNNDVMPGGWYIGTTMLLYLMAPIMFYIYDKVEYKQIFCAITSIFSGGGVILLTLIAGIINQEYIWKIVNNNSFGYFSVLTQYPCFCMGMMLYFEYRERPEKQAHGWKDLTVGLLVLAMAVILFFNPLFLFSYIVCVSVTGIASYYIIRAMLCYETRHKYPACFGCLAIVGKNSLCIYLVHCFFAWTFVRAIKVALSFIGINGDTYIAYIFLLPIAIILSCFFGYLLQAFLVLFKKSHTQR